MDQDATWCGGKTRPRRLCVRWEPTSPPQKGGGGLPPQFSAYVHCGQMAGWIKMTLLKEVGHGPGYIVLDWYRAPLPKKGTEPPPQFSAHFYCGQTSGRIKMPLGVEVGLSPGDFALDGDPALLPQQGLRLRISKLARSAGYFQL